MTDLADLPEGRWGLSRIIAESPLSFNVAAIVQGISVCKAYYPPLLADKSGYAFGFAIVHFPNGVTGTPNADTRLIPNRLLNTTLGDLTAAQTTTLRGQLEEWLTGYTYIDWDNTQQVKAAFSAAGYTAATTLKTVLLDVCRHIGLTTYRPKPIIPETHNTEYTDNFSTDPSSRWTAEMSSATWDSVNSEYDLDLSADTMLRYSANGPGSIEHESQVTNVAGTAGTNRNASVAARNENTGVNECYNVYENADGVLNLTRWNAGLRTVLSNPTGPGLSTGDFRTFRLASEGTVGSNVVLSGWYTTHGTSKPSDPGWYGVDASPTFTYTDTSVDRLDASTNDQCGIAGRGTTDYDTRHCYWKSRAITDRGGVASTPKGPLGNPFFGPFGGPI